MEEQSSLFGQKEDGKVVIPYDKYRKNITFTDTYVDIDGDVINYDDIAVFQSAAMNSSSMIYIYFSRSFTFNFSLTTYDGTVHNFKRKGYSAYGIGTCSRIKSEYEAVVDPFYNIVLKAVANRLVNRIANGATANICGLTITRDSITFTKKKQPYVIDRSNFYRALNNNGGAASFAQIYVRDQKKAVFNANLNEPNARLIVPIINCFFEYKPENPGPAAK